METNAGLELRLQQAEESAGTLAASEDHQRMLESKLYQLERDMVERSEKEAEAEMEIDGLRGRISSLETELAEFSEVRERAAALQSEHTELTRKVESALAQVDSTGSLLEQLQSSSSTKEQEVIQQLLAKTEELTSVQLQLEQAMSEREGLKSNLADWETKAGELEESLTSVRAELDSVSQASHSLQADLVTKDSNHQDQLSNFEQQILDLASQKQTLETQLEDFKKDKQALENQLSDLQLEAEQVPTLKERLLEVEEERRCASEASVQLQASRDQHLQQLDEIGSQNRQLNERYLQVDEERSALQAQLANLQQENLLVISKADDLSHERNALQSQVTHLSGMLSDKDKDMEAQSLARELAERDVQVQEATNKLESLAEEKDRLVQEVSWWCCCCGEIVLKCSFLGQHTRKGLVSLGVLKK